jgi:hypothetical protein
VRCTIFQIYFQGEQRSQIDSAFVAYDNAEKTTEVLELDVFRRLNGSASVRSLSHWGAVSWRFFEKTGLRGRELVDHIRSNPEVDLWYCNPYPYLEALFPNFWVHGATTHPGLLELASEFFAAANLPGQDLHRIEPSRHFSAANYFVGTPAFWSAYLPFINQALADAESNLSSVSLEKLHSSEADPRHWHHGATYVPFIVERLLPTFLRGPGSQLNIRRYPIPREEAKLNDELRLLRALKDQAVVGESRNLALQWMDRRNRYVKPRCAPAWWAQFGELLNPTEILF